MQAKAHHVGGGAATRTGRSFEVGLQRCKCTRNVVAGANRDGATLAERLYKKVNSRSLPLIRRKEVKDHESRRLRFGATGERKQGPVNRSERHMGCKLVVRPVAPPGFAVADYCEVSARLIVERHAERLLANAHWHADDGCWGSRRNHSQGCRTIPEKNQRGLSLRWPPLP